MLREATSGQHQRTHGADRVPTRGWTTVHVVRESRTEYVVERDGRPVARISPAAIDECRVRDLVELLEGLTAPDPALDRAVAAARTAGNRPAVPRSPWAS